MEGWIKVYRSMKERGWYQSSKHVHLWIHLLLQANHKEREVRPGGKDIIIKPGQFITGRKQLSKETGISETTIERVLTDFEKERRILTGFEVWIGPVKENTRAFLKIQGNRGIDPLP